MKQNLKHFLQISEAASDPKVKLQAVDIANDCYKFMLDIPSFEKLLTSLRTAVANEYKLDKEQTSYNDILDAFRLSSQFYKRSKS